MRRDVVSLGAYREQFSDHNRRPSSCNKKVCFQSGNRFRIAEAHTDN